MRPAAEGERAGMLSEGGGEDMMAMCRDSYFFL
jgi:hypothetical protein